MKEKKEEKKIEKYLNKINDFTILNKQINVNNITKIKKEKLEKLEKIISKNSIKNHKIKILLQWQKINHNNNFSHINKFRKNAKRLGIENEEIIRERKNQLENLFFTKTRSIKTIEPPYKTNGILKMAIFNYKKVKFFKQSKNIIKFIDVGNLYISKNDLNIWSYKKKESILLIEKENVEKIILNKSSIQITIKNNESYYLIYKENEVIFLSLGRAWKNKEFINKNRQIKKEKIINKLFA